MGLKKKDAIGQESVKSTKEIANCSEAFEVFKIEGGETNIPLFFPEKDRYSVILFGKKNEPSNIDSNRGPLYKISIRKIRYNGVHKTTTDKLFGYSCLFKPDFFLPGMDSIYQFSYFSFFGEEEFTVNIPSDRVERFSLIFDLIYRIHISSTQNKTILIASYLFVILQEAHILYSQFYELSSQNLKSSPEFITAKFKNLIASHYLQKQTVREYADMLCITPNHLNKIVKTTTGRTASEMITERILADAKRLLRGSAMNVSEIAFRIGFEDTSYFARLFRKKVGVTPLKYRRM